MRNKSESPRNVAFIGLGVMGLPMATNLIEGGYELCVYTRTMTKSEALIKRGARRAGSPKEAAKGADVVISMVGYPEDVENVHLGQEGSLRVEGKKPRVILDMTTSRPSLAQTIHQRAKDLGVGALDAPVSGGDVGAHNATLSIMVGGDDEDVHYVMPILKCLGTNIIHQGGPGAGQHTKMVNQILLASNMVGACESLLYAKHAGLDPRKVIDSVGSGAAGSWAINNLGPKMIDRDFEPGFYVEHFIKDLGIALEEAQRMKLKLPGLELAKRLYDELASKGHGRDGTQALILALQATKE